MTFVKEKRALEAKIDRLSKVDIRKFRPASSKLFTMYLSTMMVESLMLDFLDTATLIDSELKEVFEDVEGN